MIIAIAAGAAGLLVGILAGIPIGWWAHGKADLLDHDPYDPMGRELPTQVLP